ncbi:hypothetical protein HDV05_005413 [Chytridiales sp. JEL 0842]|nr:hypothetical protein HDV05_005413 [Chytridiales sp. JEL 0842]
MTLAATTSTPQSPTLATQLRDASRDVFQALHQIPISVVLSHRGLSKSTGLVAVHASTSLADVLIELKNNNILAVPVYIHPANDNMGKEYIGIVSIYDILAWTVFQKVFDKMATADNMSNLVDVSFKNWIEIEEDVNAYFKTPISELVGYTSESSVSWMLNSTDSVSTLLQMLTTSPYHRILVSNQEVFEKKDSKDVHQGASIVMLTQTDLLRWIIDYRDAFVPVSMTRIFSTPVDDVSSLIPEYHPNKQDPTQPSSLPTPTSETSFSDSPPQHHATQHIIAVPESFSAISAFRVMYTHRVSAVPIVDASGRVVANLSASDLRGITASSESLGALLLPVFEFLETKTRRTSEQLKPDQLRSVKGTDTLGSAARISLDSKIHRVWVEDDDEKPIGVLTLTDMLCFFLPAKERSPGFGDEDI